MYYSECRHSDVMFCVYSYVNKRNLLYKILCNPNIPDIPRAQVVDAKQTRPSPVLERVWLRETIYQSHREHIRPEDHVRVLERRGD